MPTGEFKQEEVHVQPGLAATNVISPSQMANADFSLGSQVGHATPRDAVGDTSESESTNRERKLRTGAQIEAARQATRALLLQSIVLTDKYEARRKSELTTGGTDVPENPKLIAAQQFGEWTGVYEVGVGGQGAALLAQNAAGQVALVKVLHSSSDAARVRFIREAKIHKALDGLSCVPHMLESIETTMVDGQNEKPRMTMEFIPGHNLNEIVGREKRLIDPRVAVDIAYLLALSVLAAEEEAKKVFGHGQPTDPDATLVQETDFAHGDVSLGNVRIGDDGRLVLLDFGLARRGTDESMAVTEDGTGVGTPLFMAPEQMGGIRTRKTDAFGVAAVSYALLTGKSPVEHRHPFKENKIPAQVDATGRVVKEEQVVLNPDLHKIFTLLSPENEEPLASEGHIPKTGDASVDRFREAAVRAIAPFLEKRADDRPQLSLKALAELHKLSSFRNTPIDQIDLRNLPKLGGEFAQTDLQTYVPSRHSADEFLTHLEAAVADESLDTNGVRVAKIRGKRLVTRGRIFAALGLTAALSIVGAASLELLKKETKTADVPVPTVPEIKKSPYKPNWATLVREEGRLKSLVITTVGIDGSEQIIEHPFDENTEWFTDNAGRISGTTFKMTPREQLITQDMMKLEQSQMANGLIELHFRADSDDTLLVLGGTGLALIPSDQNQEKVIISWPELLKNKFDPRMAEFLAAALPIEKSSFTDGRPSLMAPSISQLKLYQKRLGGSQQPAPNVPPNPAVATNPPPVNK